MSAPDQLRVIHGLVRQLGMEDDDYRAMLYRDFQVNSSKHLSDDHARLLILRLRERLGYTSGVKKFEDMAGRPGKATPAQLRMLEAMWKDVSKMHGRRQREDALEALLKNRLNLKGGLAWLDKRDVQRVVKLLKAMKADLAKKAEGSPDEKAG